MRGGREVKLAVALETAPETPREETVDQGALAAARRQGRQPVAGAGRGIAARLHAAQGVAVTEVEDGSVAADLRFPEGRHRGQRQQREDRHHEGSAARHRASRRGCGGSPSSAAANRSPPYSADESRAASRDTASLFAAAGLERDAPRPLADRLRPHTLSEVVGQDHLLGPDGALTRMLETQEPRLAGLLGPARHRQDHGGAAAGGRDRTCISSRFRRCSPASPTSRRCSRPPARGARPGTARCCSSTRCTASTARSRTPSCR